MIKTNYKMQLLQLFARNYYVYKTNNNLVE